MSNNKTEKQLADAKYIKEAAQHYQQGSIALAIAALNNLLKDTPDHALAHTNLGFLYNSIGEPSTALKHAQSAINLEPSNVNARIHHANSLSLLGEVEQAIEAFLAASKIDPSVSDIWSGLNLCFMKLGQLAKAIEYGNKGLNVNPKDEKCLNNLALSYQQSGNAESAHCLFVLACKYHPQLDYLHSNLLMNIQYLPNINSELSRHFANPFASKEKVKTSAVALEQKKSGRLRLGFVSADFCVHPIGFFLRSVLAELRQLDIEIYLYKNQVVYDDLTQEFEKHANHVESILGKSDESVSTLIKTHGIDVLFDLSGHTAGNRMGVFKLKPCPIQISWLGYFASTGVTEIDHVLMSSHQVGPNAQAYFTENLLIHKASQFVYSPPAYCPNIPVCTKTKGNASEQLVLGSFNNLAKLNNEVIKTWAGILKALPKAILLLKWKSLSDAYAKQRIINQFAQHGISSDRILCRGKSGHQQMLDEYKDIDIALDPFPFSGALTSCEALWMGKPVVTLYQERPVSRQTYAILNQLELGHLCAKTPQQYIDIVVGLAEDNAFLTAFNSEIRERMLSSNIMRPRQQAEMLKQTCLRLTRRIV